MASVAAVVAAVTVADIAMAAVVVGATLTVVGAITKDSTLSKIGMGIGLAGAVGGVAGMATGTLTSSIGGLFSESAAMSDITVPELKAPTAPGGPANTGAATFGVGNMPDITPPPADAYATGQTVNVSEAPMPSSWNVFEQAPQSGLMNTSPSSVNPQDVGNQLTNQTYEPYVKAASGSGVIGGTGDLGIDQVAAIQRGDPTTLDKVAKGWESLSSGTKMSIALAAAQAGGGVISGMFQAMSASSRLEFDRMVNAQQFSISQTQLARSTASPGVIKFGNSLLQSQQTVPTPTPITPPTGAPQRVNP